jgi:hypothetical protein
VNHLNGSVCPDLTEPLKPGRKGMRPTRHLAPNALPQELAPDHLGKNCEQR